MKKVKPDFLLRNKLSICRWANCGVYFRRLLNGRQIGLFLSAVTWPSLALTLFPCIKKIITPEQVANLHPFYDQNHIYASKVVAIMDNNHPHFYLETDRDNTIKPVLFVEHNFHAY